MYTKISDYWFVFNPNCFVERSWFMYLFTGVKHDFASPVEHVLLTVSERGSSRRALREVGAAQSVVFCVVFCRPLSIISPIFFWLVLSGLWLFCRPLSIISPNFFWLLYCLDFDLQLVITPVISPDFSWRKCIMGSLNSKYKRINQGDRQSIYNCIYIIDQSYILPIHFELINEMVQSISIHYNCPDIAEDGIMTIFKV